jgi:hypothetical protein
MMLNNYSSTMHCMIPLKKIKKAFTIGTAIIIIVIMILIVIMIIMMV